jgi:hypothetical protein
MDLFWLRSIVDDGQALVRSGKRMVGVAVLRAAGAQSLAGSLAVAPAVSASGTPAPALTVTAAADTAITASTEAWAAYFNLSATRQFATGALTNQRALVIRCPTYAFVGASTITNAATVYIDDAPQAGANATITNSYALWVNQGRVRLGGSLQVGGNVGFYGAAPVAQQTGVAVTAGAIHAALVNLGLITA